MDFGKTIRSIFLSMISIFSESPTSLSERQSPSVCIASLSSSAVINPSLSLSNTCKRVIYQYRKYLDFFHLRNLHAWANEINCLAHYVTLVNSLNLHVDKAPVG